MLRIHSRLYEFQALFIFLMFYYYICSKIELAYIMAPLPLNCALTMELSHE